MIFSSVYVRGKLVWHDFKIIIIIIIMWDIQYSNTVW
jgi:hypothetical protein